MTTLVALSLWLIEHLSPSENRHALCGDLLEQYRAGRSGRWLAREILLALAVAVWQRIGRYAMPLFFAAGWSTLYRGYASPQASLLGVTWKGVISYFLLDSGAHLLWQIAPVVTFLWVGLALFAAVRADVLHHLSPVAIGLALSSSHAALLLMVLVWPKSAFPVTLVPLLMQPAFYLGWFNIPVALSLLIAILCILPPRDAPPPRRRRRVRKHLPLLLLGRARSKPAVFLSLAALAVGSEPLQAQEGDRIRRVEQCTLPPVRLDGQPMPCVPLAARMQQLHVRGLSIAVIHQGSIEWARGYGEATSTRPVTKDTLFQAGSMSKPLAAMAALHLVQTGKLSLDTDVNKQLRSWKIPANPAYADVPVTLRELLTHTAGLSVHGFPGYAAGAPVPNLTEILNGNAPANTAPIRLESRPGVEWNYSGGGYTVLQQLLMDVSGHSFTDLLRSSVLQPIGMVHSTYQQPLPATMQGNAAAPFLRDGSALPEGAHTYPEQAAAGLWTTPSDLALYLLEVQRSLKGQANHVLSPPLTQQMVTPGKGSWGLGLQIGGSASNPYFAHGGVNAGFEGTFAAYTQTGDGAVVMTNAQGGLQLAEDVLRGIAVAYGWPDFQPTVRMPVTVDPAVLNRLVGSYGAPGGPAYAISLENGHLYATPPSGNRSELFPKSPTAFFLLDADAELHFIPRSDGKGNDLQIEHEGQTYTFPLLH